MKYGAKMVECHPSTPINTAKSHDTMEWTETNTGSTKADNKMPATAWSFHWRGVPLQPRHIVPYIFLTSGLTARSLTIARSGIRAINTKSELAIK